MALNDLPIKFRDYTEVIAEEVARFRALSPEDQVRSLDEMFRLYHFLRTTSGRAEVVDRLADEEEERGRDAIKEFAAHHE